VRAEPPDSRGPVATPASVTDKTTAAVLDGTTFGSRYQIERELGRGGMATVYLARDLQHGRAVALKVLRPELAAILGPERFLREIRLTARLDHPAILPLLDSGTDNGRLWYVMPYVEGGSLRDRLRVEVQLGVEEAVRIASEVAGALDHAHAHGVVHRDIKPENVLLNGERVLVADFGIAKALLAGDAGKLTETGLALGTPAYMSPEQAAADSHLDGRADVYALGCVLYELLMGQPPFTGPTAQAILARQAVDPVPSLRTVRGTVPPSVETAIVRALAKVPADRFASAAEFSRALTSATSAARRPWRVLPRMIRWGVPAAAGVLVAGAAGGWLVLHSRGPKILPSASRIAVLPLAPSVADTALTRLGRDLVFTVSANLDDVGEIRTVDAHTILAQSANPTTGISLPDAAALGRRFGAGSVVHGSIVRLSPRLVRLDLGLFTSDSLTRIARASVTASPDSVAVLSDSITRALLQHIWRRGEPPTPSLDAALKTRSVPALRAFLEGERALVENRWDDAAEAYASAISADSTFWLPYWRYAFSRGYWEGNDIDSVVVKAFQTHRAELPPADRLSIESFMAVRDSFSVAVARAKEVTQRFPDYWFGWLVYGDYLVHRAPILGFRVAEAGPVLERALQLNPRLVPAWEHLIWVYCKRRDPAGAIRALEALGRLGAGPSLESAEGFDELVQFRLLARLAETGGQADRALIDSVARTSAKGGGAAGGLLGWCGFRQAQAEISRQVLRLGPSPDVAASHRRFLAFNWVSRGAWDSVSRALDELTRQAPNARWSAVDGYALAVAGVWLGGLDVREAHKQRAAAARVVEQVPADEGQADLQAMLVWLDGILAWARGDPAGLQSARRELERVDRVYTSWTNAPWERSLAAFQLALTGATRQAGLALAAVEWQRAEQLSDGTFAQYLTALDRLSASRWLLEGGDTAQAARLLTWNEAWGGTSGSVGGGVFASLAYLERARIEDSRGNVTLAQEYYQEFLHRYDMPAPKQQHLVHEAREALARLSGERLPSTGSNR
jgi:hypothetical protein